MNGNINLSNQNLTITGGVNDTFYFNVTGTLNLNGANIVLNGVAANQVLFFFPGSGSAIQTNNSNTAGIFLAPQRNIWIMGGIHASEFISGGQIALSSCGGNTVVNTLPACSPEQLGLSCPASTGTVGSPYDSALVATGGVVPYTFSITSGSLPAGLTLNTSNGDVTGTPSAADPYTFTAQVTDSSGLAAGTVAQSCTVTVTASPYTCTISPTGSQCGGNAISFNSFSTQSSNAVVWVNAHIGAPSGVSTSAVTTVQFTQK